MYSIIRNGQYLCSENILLGDIEVPVRPHENAIFINGAWVINADTYFSKLDIEEAKEFLSKTQQQVLQHKEELDLNIQTTLSEDEYLKLITERTEARKRLKNE